MVKFVDRESRTDGTLPGDPPLVLTKAKQLLEKAGVSYVLVILYDHGENMMKTHDAVAIAGEPGDEMEILQALIGACRISLQESLKQLEGKPDDEDEPEFEVYS